jgi:predicted lipoprotein with Yx(FWY)xxD motif
MRRYLLAMTILAMPLPATIAGAQAMTEATAVGDGHPAGVGFVPAAKGFRFVDAHGMTLYALNMRLARSRSGATLDFCTGPCTENWTPLAAPADARPVGRWKVVKAAQGPQWSYKDDLVFTYKIDRKGTAAGDGADYLWSTIAYVPPAPTLVAPAIVAPRFVDKAYILADTDGHPLFSARGKACDADCAGWRPLLAGLAAKDIGPWSVVREPGRTAWAYRGKPVFVSETDELPAAGVLLRP